MSEAWKREKDRLPILPRQYPEMQLDAQKLEAERTVSALRDFWRNKVFERSTRGGMMLMAAARAS